MKTDMSFELPDGFRLTTTESRMDVFEAEKLLLEAAEQRIPQ